VVAGISGLVFFVSFFIHRAERPPVIFWWNTFYPYLLFVVLLIVAKPYLSNYTWEINSAIKSISLYQPGIVFILCGIIYLLLTQRGQAPLQFVRQSGATLLKIKKSVAVIILLICFAQLIQDDMSVLARSYYSNLSDLNKVFITPVMGIAGSFIVGTATMSNMLFANGVRDAVAASMHVPLFLALLNTGSSVGNAISFQNIILVKSVVSHPVTETNILKYNLIATGVYLSFVILTAVFVLMSLE
jgi:L-lactate permease